MEKSNSGVTSRGTASVGKVASKPKSAPQAASRGARSIGDKESGKVEPVSLVEEGDRLPAATLHDQNGDAFDLSTLRGKAALVYFYPRDDTPGCTREACSFQSNLSSLKRLGVTVVGISPDSSERHARFAAKYKLRFTLLADPDRDYAKRCGVLVPKTLYGRTSIGIERTTFLLDPKGVVRRVWRKVKVDGHTEQVLAAIKQL